MEKIEKLETILVSLVGFVGIVCSALLNGSTAETEITLWESESFEFFLFIESRSDLHPIHSNPP